MRLRQIALASQRLDAVVQALGQVFGLRVVRYAAHAPPPEGQGPCTTG